jgi:hypothetical protein
LLGAATPCLWIIPFETGKFSSDRFGFDALPRAGAAWRGTDKISNGGEFMIISLMGWDEIRK